MDAASIYQERPDEYHQFLRDYYKDEIAELKLSYPSEQKTLVVDYHDIYRWDSDVAYDLRENPETFRTVFEHALKEVDFGPQQDLEQATVAITNATDPYQIPELTGDEVESLVTIRGQVAKTSAVKPRLTVAGMRCQSCGTINKISQPRHGVNEPGMCHANGCKGKSFEPDFDQSEWVSHQLIRVKQPPEDADGEESIDVHLTKDMAGKVTAGERVDITGVLKTDFEDLDTPIPEFYIIGHSVSLHESDYEDMDVQAQKEQFESYASGEDGDPYQLLIDSIAPTIQGDEKLETIKLAVALQLFGGWRRAYGDGRHVRGDSHMAIIGEAGTGKSSILEAAESISPRSGYVSGKNATKAGVTAAAVRDDFGDTEWSLEAGAIVKAHKGLCCIDEIDKVDDDVLSSLHTALEKQRLEVNKAGIDASLRCHTSVLSAGNPENGEFIKEQPVLAQLNLGPTLRSRFDLIFTLRDTPDSEKDQQIAQHMMKMRQLSGLIGRGENPDGADEIMPAVEIPVLRAWIAYAREHINPVIEDETLLEQVGDWFAENRSVNEEDKTMNRRMVDAVARLAEASARVRLDETVAKSDIERAKKIIEQSLSDLQLLDGEGPDITEVDSGAGKNQRNRVKTLLGVIDSLETEDSGAEKENIIETAVSTGLDRDKAESEFENMRHAGEIYKPDGWRVA